VCFPCLEAFAVVREAAKRTIGMRHFDVQVCLYLYPQVLVHAISWVHFYNLEERLLSILMFHLFHQIIGGGVLHDGSIAEMKTGEGKTLVSTLAAYLNALTGEGVHGMLSALSDHFTT